MPQSLDPNDPNFGEEIEEEAPDSMWGGVKELWNGTLGAIPSLAALTPGDIETMLRGNWESGKAALSSLGDVVTGNGKQQVGTDQIPQGRLGSLADAGLQAARAVPLISEPIVHMADKFVNDRPWEGAGALTGLVASAAMPGAAMKGAPRAAGVVGRGIENTGNAAARFGENTRFTKGSAIPHAVVAAGGEGLMHMMGLPPAMATVATAAGPAALRAGGHVATKVGRALQGLEKPLPVLEHGGMQSAPRSTPATGPSIFDRMKGGVERAAGGLDRMLDDVAQSPVVSRIMDSKFGNAVDSATGSVIDAIDPYIDKTSFGRRWPRNEAAPVDRVRSSSEIPTAPAGGWGTPTPATSAARSAVPSRITPAELAAEMDQLPQSLRGLDPPLAESGARQFAPDMVDSYTSPDAPIGRDMNPARSFEPESPLDLAARLAYERGTGAVDDVPVSPDAISVLDEVPEFNVVDEFDTPQVDPSMGDVNQLIHDIPETPVPRSRALSAMSEPAPPPSLEYPTSLRTIEKPVVPDEAPRTSRWDQLEQESPNPIQRVTQEVSPELPPSVAALESGGGPPSYTDWAAQMDEIINGATEADMPRQNATGLGNSRPTNAIKEWMAKRRAESLADGTLAVERGVAPELPPALPESWQALVDGVEPVPAPVAASPVRTPSAARDSGRSRRSYTSNRRGSPK